MRKALLLVLTLTMTIVAVAADITPDAARQQATQFVIEQFMSGKAFRRSSAQPQLTMATRQSGLYVFNVDNGNGYVIVADDDRAETILGYSNSGSFDPQHIPTNMRAWLQGYADEIAWLKEHGSRTAPIMATKRSIKQAIAPLVATLWDQDTPFNDQVKDYFVHGDAVTGCVATAMAQVMYYTATEAGQTSYTTTSQIPGYTTGYSYSVPAIDAGTTLAWSDMIPDYSGDYSDAAAAAVATLMRCCGVSVKMNYANAYNGGSSAVSENIPTALTTYFGYDSSTQLIDRNKYSYSSWIEIIYHELTQGRPVLYGGQSSGGGHEFVCDGYQGEDYFHINWGWGGSSDNYFKLSALNPYDQGIGGSSTKDGFHFSQDAIVGIQLQGAGGTILNVPQCNFNLELNSIVIDKESVAKGESVIITMNITNKADEDYDADIFLADKNTYSVIAGWDYHIPAGETKDCVFNYTTTDTGDYLITPVDGKLNWLAFNTTVSLTVTASGGSSTPTTDNITLGKSLTIDNSEGNIFYGNTLKGELTISNPNSTYNYKGTYQFDIYDTNNNLQWRFNSTITIPSNGSITVPFEMEGAEVNSQYLLAVTYIKDSAWTKWDHIGWYTCNPGITAYHADGTKSVTKVSTHYAASTGTLAVDMTDTGVTNVTCSEPNCLFIIGTNDEVPTGATNIIRYDGTEYTAGDITLKDGNDFYSPVDFTAQNVEFTYNFTVAADGTNGWNTIMLPFDVTKVTADGVDIDWFHSSTDTGKNFWLKEYTGDEGQTVNFDFAAEMKANKPYIVAFPGNKWGSKWDMSNKEIKFIGEKIGEKVAVSNTKSPAVVTANNYRFVGSTTAQSTSNIYVLNADGNQFVSGSGSGAFRAFFKPGIYDRSVNSLTIGSKPADGTTGIENIENRKSEIENYYNLNGQRVSQPAKGIFIHNGRKVIIK